MEGKESSQEKLNDEIVALTEKTKKIKRYFKELKERLTDKGESGAEELLNYLKSLEKLMGNIAVVGTAMFERGLKPIQSKINFKMR